MSDTTEADTPVIVDGPGRERGFAEWHDACHGNETARRACGTGTHVGVVAGGLRQAYHAPDTLVCMSELANGPYPFAPTDTFGWQAVTGVTDPDTDGVRTSPTGTAVVWCQHAGLIQSRVRDDAADELWSMARHLVGPGGVVALVADPPAPDSPALNEVKLWADVGIVTVGTTAWRLAGLVGPGRYTALPVCMYGDQLGREYDWEHSTDRHAFGGIVRRGEAYEQRRDAVLLVSALVAEMVRRRPPADAFSPVWYTQITADLHLSDRRGVIKDDGLLVGPDIPTLPCCQPPAVSAASQTGGIGRRDARVGTLDGAPTMPTAGQSVAMIRRAM